MLRLLRWSPLLVAVLLLLGSFLPKQRNTVVIPSAFRWRNSPWMDGGERLAVERNGIQRVYVKLLDIDWNAANGAYPVASVRVPDVWRSYWHNAGEWTSRVELVPSIYITNNTFLKMDDAGTDLLAHNLLRKLRIECPAVFHGVMLDCDWTARTKDRFFRLTRILNDSLNVQVTATIRLHQYAHPGKTGVPPADRGMLMPYNVGTITEPGGVNSIFDPAVAAPYFASAKPYPLPLDVALPAFSWGVQFRNNAFVGILQEEQVNTALSNGLLAGGTHGTLQVTNENNDVMPQLHLGDMIRVERVTSATIDQVTQLARNAVNSDTMAVTFFELGTSTFQQLEKADVRAAYERFGALRPTWGAPPDPDEEGSESAVDTAMTTVADSAAWMASDSAVALPFVTPAHSTEP